MKAHRSFIRALVVLVAVFAFSAFVSTSALAQSPSPTASAVAPTPTETPAEGEESPDAAPVVVEPGPPASYYASYGLIAIGGLTVLAVLAGYLFQAPGFRRSKGSSS